MNFDTRTALDLFQLDSDLKAIVASIIDGERILWEETQSTSQNDFVRHVIPLVKDELKFYLKTYAYRKKLSFIRPLIDLDKIDYYRLIPEVSDII